MIRTFLSALLLSSAIAGAEPHGAPLAEPKTLLRMITALEESKDDRFNSRASTDEGPRTTYHLCSFEYLGSVVKGEERFLLAAAGYIRSYPEGMDALSARGHSYFIVFRPDFTIAASCREMVANCHMDGNVLKRGEKVVADFNKRDVFTRRGGYVIDGGNELPYFFSDRITEEQWQDENFMKKELAKPD